MEITTTYGWMKYTREGFEPAEGVTLSGVPQGMVTVYGHTLESLFKSAEGVRTISS